jgi:hypothetical protein
MTKISYIEKGKDSWNLVVLSLDKSDEKTEIFSYQTKKDAEDAKKLLTKINSFVMI